MATPTPPPRFTGDQKTDTYSMFQWMEQFYTNVVRDQEYTTQVDVDTTVDPVNASAASAQATANTALTNAATAQTAADAAQTSANSAQSTANTANSTANANKTTLDAQNSGSVTISGTSTTGVVTLSPAQADTSYYVSFGQSAISGTPAADSYIIESYSKATGSFTITLKAAPGVGNSVTIDWNLMR